MPPRLSSSSWLALALRVAVPRTIRPSLCRGHKEQHCYNSDLYENSEQRTNFAQTTTFHFFLLIFFPHLVCFEPNSESICLAWGQGTAASAWVAAAFFKTFPGDLAGVEIPCRHEDFASLSPAPSEARNFLGTGQYCLTTRAYSSSTWLA